MKGCDVISDRTGVMLCGTEEKHVIPLMVWLQTHHNVSCVNMISYRDVVSVLADETDTSMSELLRAQLDDLIAHTGVSVIAVVDYRLDGRGGLMRNRERMNAALLRAQ